MAETSAMITSGTTDLLQQAMQRVISDDGEVETHEQQFVRLLQGGTALPQPGQSITLTPSQAAALGLTFERDPPDVIPKILQTTCNIVTTATNTATSTWAPVLQSSPIIVKSQQTAKVSIYLFIY